MPTVAHQVRGLAQLLRVKPVLSWGIAALLLGASVSYARVGASVDLFNGLLAVVLVVVAQGIVSHGLNDAYDWITGTDKESIGKGTGGSRVIPEGKMTLAGTIAAAVGGLVVVLAIGGYFITEFGAPVVVLIAIAVWSPVAYSVPPLKLGYRPFNEVFVVLPALVGVVVGTDMVLSGSWSWFAVNAGVMHAFYCMSWFIVSRVPDYRPDKEVDKITTVVYVGLENSRFVAWAYLTVGGVVAALLGMYASPVFFAALIPYVLISFFIATFDPFNPHQASASRLKAMHTTTLNAVVISALLVAVGV